MVSTGKCHPDASDASTLDSQVQTHSQQYKSAKYTSPQVLIEDLAQLLRPIYEIPDSHSLVCALGLFQPQSEQSFGRSHTSTENRIQALKSSKRSPPQKKLPNKAGALAAISNHPIPNAKVPQVTTSGFRTQTSKPKMGLKIHIHFTNDSTNAGKSYWRCMAKLHPCKFPKRWRTPTLSLGRCRFQGPGPVWKDVRACSTLPSSAFRKSVGLSENLEHRSPYSSIW